jgi:hypothetical protein
MEIVQRQLESAQQSRDRVLAFRVNCKGTYVHTLSTKRPPSAPTTEFIFRIRTGMLINLASTRYGIRRCLTSLYDALLVARRAPARLRSVPYAVTV